MYCDSIRAGGEDDHPRHLGGVLQPLQTPPHREGESHQHQQGPFIIYNVARGATLCWAATCTLLSIAMQRRPTLLGTGISCIYNIYLLSIYIIYNLYIYSQCRQIISYLHVTSYTSWCRSREVMPGKLSDDGYLSDKNWALNEERFLHTQT